MIKNLALTFIFMNTLAHAGSSFLDEQVAKAKDLLPENYYKSKVIIEESKLSGDEFISEDLCKLDERIIFGLTLPAINGKRIVISKRLLELAQSSTKTFKCSHGTFEKVLQAVLIHELTHVKDHEEKISTDANFQRIAGVKRVQSSSTKKLLNQNSAASPDAYEFKNLAEALAVNTEYLVLDPEFECRRPAMANFLSAKLGIPLKGQCQKNITVPVQSAFVSDNYLYTTKLDLNRLYQVHYLFAGKGRALMSRWGHAMFRMVMCAPFRTEVGPECMKDVSHHIVISYRAYISEVSLDYAKGLAGNYPSQLFITRYHEVQQEYNKYELRDLYSVPLKLTLKQKKEFIDLTLERYWSYQGKYYFIDNNCGTEANKHLAAVLDQDQSHGISSLTPLKMYQDISSSSVLEGSEQKIESQYSELEKSYLYLQEQGLFREMSFPKFLKKSTAVSRRSTYIEFFEHAKANKLILSKINHLERFFEGRFMLSLSGKAIEKIKKDPSLKAAVEKFGKSMLTLIQQPWDVTPSRYGVPTKSEFERGYDKFSTERKAKVIETIEQQFANIDGLLSASVFKEELEEMNSIKEIKSIIKTVFEKQ